MHALPRFYPGRMQSRRRLVSLIYPPIYLCDSLPRPAQHTSVPTLPSTSTLPARQLLPSSLETLRYPVTRR
jgi:hypothetical protein